MEFIDILVLLWYIESDFLCIEGDVMKSVYFKIFVRIFVLFVLLNSSLWLGYLLINSDLPEPVTYFGGLFIIFGHLGMGAAVFNEFPEYKK
jgi:hypothetical protein